MCSLPSSTGCARPAALYPIPPPSCSTGCARPAALSPPFFNRLGSRRLVLIRNGLFPKMAACSHQRVDSGAPDTDSELGPDTGPADTMVDELPVLTPQEIELRLQRTRKELSNRRKILVKNLRSDSNNQVPDSRGWVRGEGWRPRWAVGGGAPGVAAMPPGPRGAPSPWRAWAGGREGASSRSPGTPSRPFPAPTDLCFIDKVALNNSAAECERQREKFNSRGWKLWRRS